jgi:hypothetical protein
VTREPRYIEFRADDRAEVVACMDELERTRAGWINVQPGLDPEDVPAVRAGAFGLLSGRGPDVPLATWVPGELKREEPQPASVGIQHGTGPRLAARLADAGVPVPDGWRVTQDHARRGLVVAIPVGTSNDAVLDWLVRAAATLSPVPLTGDWRAAVYESR